MMSIRFLVSLVMVAALNGCGTTAEHRKFASAQDASAQYAGEERVWEQARRFDDYLVKTKHIFDDPATNQYLQSVMDKLFPEFEGKITVQAVRLPSFNAFALPNGSIYIHVGLLARLDNESQLATILAHEGVHFTHRHSALARSNRRKSENAAAAMSFIFTPLFSSAALMSSVAGFSRELETEADYEGYARLAEAGYDVGESAKVFQFLADEVAIENEKTSYFFATHPKLQERIANYTELALSAPPQQPTDAREFLENTLTVRLAGLEADLEHARYDNLIHLLEQPNAMERYPDDLDFYLAEAHRRRNKNDDLTKAAASYQIALSRNPKHGNAHKGLALVMRQQGNNADAVSHFKQYIALSPDATDAKFVAQYIEQLLENTDE